MEGTSLMSGRGGAWGGGLVEDGQERRTTSLGELDDRKLQLCIHCYCWGKWFEVTLDPPA